MLKKTFFQIYLTPLWIKGYKYQSGIRTFAAQNGKYYHH